jgi:hypothetical protein
MDAAKGKQLRATEREFCSQTYFSVNNDNAKAWKYMELRSSEV